MKPSGTRFVTSEKCLVASFEISINSTILKVTHSWRNPRETVFDQSQNLCQEAKSHHFSFAVFSSSFHILPKLIAKLS